MSWFVIAVIIIVVLAIVVLKLSPQQGARSTDYPYRKLDVLFSPAERSFFGVLNQAVGDNAQIFGKVRVADVIAPEKGMPRSQWQKAFNKISSKHFDYLLCDKNDLSILCAIELNDSSHNSKKQKNRDAFLEGACLSAAVPLVQFTARATYKITDIQHSLAAFLPEKMAPKPVAETGAVVINNSQIDSEKLCPKCSAVMVMKLAKKGSNTGNEFWACSEFPKCRHTESTSA
jgi:hypothetical protein